MEFVKQALETETNYLANISQIIQKMNDNENFTKETINYLKQTIKNKKNSSQSKFFSLKIIKEAMNLNKDHIVIYIESKILKRLGILAEFNKKSQALDRGKLLFGIYVDLEYANNFFFLLLECIQNWNYRFPIEKNTGENSKFAKLYENLKKKGVFFPDLEENRRKSENLKDENEDFGIPVHLSSRIQLHYEDSQISAADTMGKNNEFEFFSNKIDKNQQIDDLFQEFKKENKVFSDEKQQKINENIIFNPFNDFLQEKEEKKVNENDPFSLFFEEKKNPEPEKVKEIEKTDFFSGFYQENQINSDWPDFFGKKSNSPINIEKPIESPLYLEKPLEKPIDFPKNEKLEEKPIKTEEINEKPIKTEEIIEKPKIIDFDFDDFEDQKSSEKSIKATKLLESYEKPIEKIEKTEKIEKSDEFLDFPDQKDDPLADFLDFEDYQEENKEKSENNNNSTEFIPQIQEKETIIEKKIEIQEKPIEIHDKNQNTLDFWQNMDFLSRFSQQNHQKPSPKNILSHSNSTGFDDLDDANKFPEKKDNKFIDFSSEKTELTDSNKFLEKKDKFIDFSLEKTEITESNKFPEKKDKFINFSLEKPEKIDANKFPERNDNFIDFSLEKTEKKEILIESKEKPLKNDEKPDFTSFKKVELEEIEYQRPKIINSLRDNFAMNRELPSIEESNEEEGEISLKMKEKKEILIIEKEFISLKKEIENTNKEIYQQNNENNQIIQGVIGENHEIKEILNRLWDEQNDIKEICQKIEQDKQYLNKEIKETENRVIKLNTDKFNELQTQFITNTEKTAELIDLFQSDQDLIKKKMINIDKLLGKIDNIDKIDNKLQEITKEFEKTKVAIHENSLMIQKSNENLSINLKNQNKENTIKNEISPIDENSIKYVDKRDFFQLEKHVLESKTQLDILKNICESLQKELNKVIYINNERENLPSVESPILKKLEIFETKLNRLESIKPQEIPISKEIKIIEEKSLDYSLENNEKISEIPEKQSKYYRKPNENSEKSINLSKTLKKSVNIQSPDPSNSLYTFVSPIKSNPLSRIEHYCNNHSTLDNSELKLRQSNLQKSMGNSMNFHDPYKILLNYSKHTTPYKASKSPMNSSFYITKEKFRGRIVYVSRNKLTNILKKLNTSSHSFKNDVKMLKNSVLAEKSILFEDKQLLIAVQSTRIEKNSLFLQILLIEKGKKGLSEIDFAFLNTNIRAKIIQKDEKIELKIDCSPLECAEPVFTEIKCRISGRICNLTIVLPVFLYKFYDFIFTNKENFIEFWKKHKENLLSTEPLRLNRELIRNKLDLSRILPNIVDLKQYDGSKSGKLGCFLVVFSDFIVAIRLVLFNESLLIVQIMAESAKSSILTRIQSEILNELSFIISE